MLQGLFILIGCNLAGVIIVGLTGITIPSAVVGMLILLTGLFIKGRTPHGVLVAGEGLLKHIGLLFVPAGAGISMYLGLIAQQWHVILVASVSATILTMIASSLLFQIFKKAEE